MRVELAYGTKGLTIDLPPDRPRSLSPTTLGESPPPQPRSRHPVTYSAQCATLIDSLPLRSTRSLSRPIGIRYPRVPIRSHLRLPPVPYSPGLGEHSKERPCPVRVELAYGTKGLTIDLPPDRTTVIEPDYPTPLPNPEAAILHALRNLIDSAPTPATCPRVPIRSHLRLRRDPARAHGHHPPSPAQRT